MKRIVVTGGRKFSDKEFVHSILNKLREKSDFILIHGDASGLDLIAKNWAIEFNNNNQIPFPANWNDLSSPCKIKYRNGKAYNALAGFNRNQQMIDEGKPDLGIVFDGGNGTNDMANRLMKCRVPIYDCRKEK